MLISFMLKFIFPLSGFFVGLVFVWKCQQGSLEKGVGDPVEDSLILMIAVISVETGVTMPTTAIVSAREVAAAGKFSHG